MRKRIDEAVDHPITEVLDRRETPKTVGVNNTDRWTWCDALYMAPPTLVRLYAATGDKKYLDFLDKEYRQTYDQLYDHGANLFYRDGTFIDRRTSNGKKVFWSRGNGWVYAGLALLLEKLPPDYPSRPFYEKLFRQMTPAIVAAQQADGLWRPNLADPQQFKVGETSGSALFVFGLAWGVDHGLIDRATYWPAVERGWRGLKTRIKPDGYVGYVQRVAAAPGSFDANSRGAYGTGAVLLAGSEILRALGDATKVAPEKVLAAAQAQVDADHTPRAYARLVPLRDDDLAWENDHIADRIYGPALRNGIENSGIDVWFKSVPYPVVDQRYRNERLYHISYHKDHGNGYDGYKVSNSRGDGGLGIWRGGRIVTSNTFISDAVIWTRPDVAEFTAEYEYPPVPGHDNIHEARTVRLHMGDRLNEITSRFTINGKPVAGLEIAVGLETQHPKAEMDFQPGAGWMTVWETVDGKGLGTAAIFAPGTVLKMMRLPQNSDLEQDEQALAIVRTDANGTITYRAGFGWTGERQIMSKDAWTKYVEAQSGSSREKTH
ncbi:MAG: DUF4861 domain-containing protein [Rhodanobacter sp.]|nr:MAG: DUF4861 domain-containing protein [Rhodanobacter sp.]